jgi:hypothetical protein
MKKWLVVSVIVMAALVFASPALAWDDGWSDSDLIYYYSHPGWVEHILYVQVDRQHVDNDTWDFQRIRAKTNNTGHNKNFTFTALARWDGMSGPWYTQSANTISVPAGTWVTLTFAQVNPDGMLGLNWYAEYQNMIGKINVDWYEDGWGHVIWEDARITRGDRQGPPPP